ncbi:hypothetical protein ACQP2U_10230 [Nocardia sp. CA-084685]|uniref:hypothetical protein n=1 Tax=Nocardia sp. CA-084685 TaxID=3239970 RepID=UPI003D9554AC
MDTTGRYQRVERGVLAGAIVVAVQLHREMGVGQGERVIGRAARPCLRPFDRT